MHPALTKKQKPWETVELLWLNFLQTYTSYSEGQGSAAKVPELMELLISLCLNSRKENKICALEVLRNIAFYQPNRSKLLISDDFLNVLQVKLTDGYVEEKILIVVIIWALVANSQKAKLVFKCINLDLKLQDALKNLQVLNVVTPDQLQKMHYVLNILTDRENV